MPANRTSRRSRGERAFTAVANGLFALLLASFLLFWPSLIPEPETQSDVDFTTLIAPAKPDRTADASRCRQGYHARTIPNPLAGTIK